MCVYLHSYSPERTEKSYSQLYIVIVGLGKIPHHVEYVNCWPHVDWATSICCASWHNFSFLIINISIYQYLLNASCNYLCTYWIRYQECINDMCSVISYYFPTEIVYIQTVGCTDVAIWIVGMGMDYIWLILDSLSILLLWASVSTIMYTLPWC